MMKGWISVKDELPSNEDKVWVLNLDDITRYNYHEPKSVHRLRIYEANFSRNEGWNIVGSPFRKVMYWTPMDYSGVSREDFEFIRLK
jgi:hypothetical protein